MPVPSQPQEDIVGYDVRATTPNMAMGASNRFPAAPTAPFLPVHWRGRSGSWELIDRGAYTDDPVWLPRIEPFLLVPGANGVATVEDGDSAEPHEGALNYLRRMGALIVPATYVWKGSPGYMLETPCMHPTSRQSGRFYFWRFERLIPPPAPDQVGRARMDYAELDAWRYALVVDDIIPAPDQRLIREQIERYEKAVASRRTADIAADVKDERVNDARARLERARAARLPTEERKGQEPAAPSARAAKRGAA